jgi:hypothetical protein
MFADRLNPFSSYPWRFSSLITKQVTAIFHHPHNNYILEYDIIFIAKKTIYLESSDFINGKYFQKLEVNVLYVAHFPYIEGLFYQSSASN